MKLRESVADMNDAKSSSLKQYLTQDFGNPQHKRWSLLDIYRDDLDFWKLLKKKGKIRADALAFFDINKKSLEKANKIPTESFRNLSYDQIISKYLDKVSAATNFSKMLCPYDLQIMSCLFVEKVKEKNGSNKQFQMPLYECKKCGRTFTSVGRYPDLYHIRFQGTEYINLKKSLTKQENNKRPVVPWHMTLKQPCYICTTHPATCKCREPQCHRQQLISVRIDFTLQNGNQTIEECKICPNCGTVYISYALYRGTSNLWECKNLNEVAKNMKAFQQQEQERKRKSREKEKLKIERMNKAQIQQRKALEAKWQEEQHQKDAIAAQIKRMRENASVLNTRQPTPKIDSTINPNSSIHVKDFVVRRSVFKCRFHDHKLQNINASISLITSNGEIIKVTVPAGYCPDCRIFFIMESTYEDIKRRGTPICRVSDEKSYLNETTFANGMKLAQQSILMQYGYNVSQEENLSPARRHKILAVIIDNKILTKSEVIGYLDFFINQRQSQPKFELAIAKWESDREFVSDYKKGEYATYGVKRIHRKY